MSFDTRLIARCDWTDCESRKSLNTGDTLEAHRLLRKCGWREFNLGYGNYATFCCDECKAKFTELTSLTESER